MEGRISERANGNTDKAWQGVVAVIHGSAAKWAEVEGERVARFGISVILPRLARDEHALLAKPGLGAKYATSSPLASDTVAHGHANRLSHGDC